MYCMVSCGKFLDCWNVAMCTMGRACAWHASTDSSPPPQPPTTQQLLVASLETASDSLRRQAGERDEADAAGQVCVPGLGGAGMAGEWRAMQQAGPVRAACRALKPQWLAAFHLSSYHMSICLNLACLCAPPEQEANDAVFELNERLAGQAAELAAAREALAAHQQRAAALEVGGMLPSGARRLGRHLAGCWVGISA